MILGVLTVNAQDNYDRLYPSQKDKDVITLSSIQIKSGHYVSLQLELEPQEEGSDEPLYGDTLIISKYQANGNISWTHGISLGGSYDHILSSASSIVEGRNDTLYFSFLSYSDNIPTAFIGSITTGGVPGFLKVFGQNTFSNDSSDDGNFLINTGKLLVNAHTKTEDDIKSVIVSGKNFEGHSMWSQELSPLDLNTGLGLEAFVTSLKLSNDNIIMSGGTNGVSLHVTLLDTLGNPTMSHIYTDEQSLISIPIGSFADQLPDSSFIIAGSMIKLIPPQSLAFRGFVIKTNKTGEVEWSKEIIFGDGDFTIINNLTVDNRGGIVISGGNIDLGENAVYPFLIKSNALGDVEWQKKFPRSTNVMAMTSGLYPNTEGGYNYMTAASVIDKRSPQTIKTDANGETGCESNIDEIILFDLLFSSDTLIWENKSIELITEDVPYNDDTYDFIRPRSIIGATFCKKEPIDWTFDATNPGAISYQWSDGSTENKLRVFEEGEYTVIIKIDENFCYTLLDTAKIERYPEPSTWIETELGNFCENGMLTLRMQYIPGHPSWPSNIAWSNGIVGGSSTIEIPSPGSYSVTVTDACDETATASIKVDEFPKPITEATISDETEVDCLTGRVTGSLIARGNATGLLANHTYLWSTGETTQTIQISDSEEKSYSVTVSDLCGNSVEKSIEIPIIGTNKLAVTIDVDYDLLCTDRVVRLNAILAQQSNNVRYSWNTGHTTPNIEVAEEGTYSVTVTDLCDNTAEDSESVELSSAINDLIFAKIFFPDGTTSPSTVLDTSVTNSDLYKNAEMYNRTFGPVNQPAYCLEQVRDYELHIFNRWGQEVFVSNQLRDEWDGTFKGQPAPSESYVWVAKYSLFDEQRTVKGAVTLIRL